MSEQLLKPLRILSFRIGKLSSDKILKCCSIIVIYFLFDVIYLMRPVVYLEDLMVYTKNTF